MSYLDLFQRYGNPSREAEIRLTAYLLRPDTLTADRIKAHDDSAARMIARCNELVDQLTEYRSALAERYAALATAAYRERLELTRDPGYRGKPVIYFVRIVRTYEDGTTERVLDEKYFGTERRKAFARFAELKKQRPGIETMQDTEHLTAEKEQRPGAIRAAAFLYHFRRASQSIHSIAVNPLPFLKTSYKSIKF